MEAVLLSAVLFPAWKVESIRTEAHRAVYPERGTGLEEDTRHVLFIGNSHTWVNDVPYQVLRLARDIEGVLPLDRSARLDACRMALSPSSPVRPVPGKCRQAGHDRGAGVRPGVARVRT